ncbi:hypothetical protein KP509_16G021900 [Ceratopteris richardii]|uniref:Phosphatidylinositol 3,4,5-trisphosphate 3-phosphatase and dual-specificity protein phosphatase PTEN n=1 Tax=Ceratopteris richardii TaxID=49495 RepID=A0A8T2T1C6_CERRI|nr:hypothetical protein KP509_16G021900 [Ceratopteris richardii]
MDEQAMAAPPVGVASPWLNVAPVIRMKTFARKIVSKKKRRFKQHGFNLDLSYITPRIIAMAFPCEGAESIYRNDISEVSAFLNMFHENHFKVFNLCAERTYDPAKLGGNVEWMPFTDHSPAPTEEIFCFCEHAYDWLIADPNNVIVVHCKAGKGRTGLMVCAYLLYSRECSDPVTAIQYYGEKRTKNGKGLTISSQRRYLFYFYDLWKHGPRNLVPLVISRISLYSNVSMKHDIAIQISCNGGNGSFQLNQILDSQHGGCVANLVKEGKNTTFLFSEVRIMGDVRIAVYDARYSGKPIFYFWFNTAFVDGNLFTLASKSELDKPSKVIVVFSSRLLQKFGRAEVMLGGEGRAMEHITKKLSNINRFLSPVRRY